MPKVSGEGARRVNTGESLALRPKYSLAEQALKPDAAQRPLYVGGLVRKQAARDGRGGEAVVELFLETFTPGFKDAYDFVVHVAEPHSRQEFLQSYHIKAASLFAAVTYGYDAAHILARLGEFNKFREVAAAVKDFIAATAASFGKCRLVLQGRAYFLESEDAAVLRYYRDIPKLARCWEGEVRRWEGDAPDARTAAGAAREDLAALADNGELYRRMEELARADAREEKGETFRLGVRHAHIDDVRIEREEEDRYKYMLSQEYDYLADEGESLPIALRPTTRIRGYQEAALNRVFVNGRARSGIVVLPCGAGKTLLGICALCQMRRHTLIICINNLTVNQWCSQLALFAELEPGRLFRFYSDEPRARLPDLAAPCVVVSTYTMISRGDEGRSDWARQYMERIAAVEWGLLLLDEVQVAPAEIFKRAFLTKTASHCKLGLTATLLREDNKIQDLQFYIGPKLYEESWIELTRQGFLASVQCIEIRVRMAPVFAAEYRDRHRRENGRNFGVFLYTANPGKFVALQYLIEHHRARGHKILVFVDSIDILTEFARILQYPFIIGDMKQYEREKILQFFKLLPGWNVLFISRVGDVGIDIPDANVAIEVSSHYGSRRQEAQRLGRILRPKERRGGEAYQSFFYTLVSLGTEETRYALKRQKFLVKQGYQFHVLEEDELPCNAQPERRKHYRLATDDEQKQFLDRVMVRSAVSSEPAARAPRRATLQRGLVEGTGVYIQR